MAGGYMGGTMIPKNKISSSKKWEELKSKGFKVESLESYPILYQFYIAIYNAEIDEAQMSLQDDLFNWANTHMGCGCQVPERFNSLF
jgi:hypothetical protein